MKIGYTLKNKDLFTSKNLSYKRWIYLSDDYSSFIKIRDFLDSDITIENVSENFSTIYNIIVAPFIQILTDIGKKVDPSVWWSGEIASRSTTACELLRDSIYAEYARKIISESHESSILFVCENVSLVKCIHKIAHKYGKAIHDEYSGVGKFDLRISFLTYIYKIIVFIVRFFYIKIIGRNNIIPLEMLKRRKIIVLRSWITDGTVDSSGAYHDRNFGKLPGLMKKAGYNIVVIPMMFNVGRSLKNHLKKMATTGETFVIPALQVSIFSFIFPIFLELKRLKINIKNIQLNGIDIADIFHYHMRRQAFRTDLMMHSLVYPMMKKMFKNRIEVEQFIYAFENLTVEKLFIIAVKKYYPGSLLKAFQHTIIVPQQAATFLHDSERSVHPFPDEIICSSRMFKKILSQLNFPDTILKEGPALRYAALKKYPFLRKNRQNDEEIKICTPLSYNDNLTFETLDKLHAALLLTLGMKCVVYIKPHPLTNMTRLHTFLKTRQQFNYTFIEDPCTTIFKEVDIAAFVGTSIVQLEAAACGIPILRIIPDNTFHMDPFNWFDYPVEAARFPRDISEKINECLLVPHEVTRKIAEKCKNVFFNDDCDECVVNSFFAN